VELRPLCLCGVAKICEHEKWHKQLASEIQWDIHILPLPPGGTYKTPNNDDDGDGLTNEREDEIGSNRKVRDSFGMSTSDPDYSTYSSYADEEVFCRLIQKALGVESSDWFIAGPQVLKISRGIQ
jgi:hypothetical protein